MTVIICCLRAHRVWRQINLLNLHPKMSCVSPVTMAKCLSPTHPYPASTVITLAALQGLHFGTAVLRVPPWGIGKWFSPFHSPFPSGCGRPYGSWCGRCWELRSKIDHYVEKPKSNPDSSFCGKTCSCAENGIKMAKDHHKGSPFISLTSYFVSDTREKSVSIPWQRVVQTIKLHSRSPARSARVLIRTDLLWPWLRHFTSLCFPVLYPRVNNYVFQRISVK